MYSERLRTRVKKKVMKKNKFLVMLYEMSFFEKKPQLILLLFTVCGCVFVGGRETMCG